MYRIVVIGLLVMCVLACGGAATKDVYSFDKIEVAELGCSFLLTNGDGKQVRFHGVYDICPDGDRPSTKLVGKMVTILFTTVSEPAASCGGNIDCNDYEEADWVKAIHEYKN